MSPTGCVCVCVCVCVLFLIGCDLETFTTGSLSRIWAERHGREWVRVFLSNRREIVKYLIINFLHVCRMNCELYASTYKPETQTSLQFLQHMHLQNSKQKVITF